jgi:hypothetical protein
MKLRFGEFPEDHHFILITRPFVEWTFKVLGWLILLLRSSRLSKNQQSDFALP